MTKGERHPIHRAEFEKELKKIMADTIDLVSDSDEDVAVKPEPQQSTVQSDVQSEKQPMRLCLQLGASVDKPIDLDAEDGAAFDLQRRITIDLTSAAIDFAQLDQERNARRDAAQAAAGGQAVDVDTIDLLEGLREKLAEHVKRNGLPQQQYEGDEFIFGQGQGRRLQRQQRDASLPIWSNPKSAPGQPLYERFVAAWQRAPNQQIQLVFHGTSEQNIATICTDGLDPARRAGQACGPGEYFGKQMAVSHGYCRGGRHMLIFAVLLDRSGVTYNQGGVIVINKAEHQLPLAVVTMSGEGYKPPQSFHTAVSNPHTTAGAQGRRQQMMAANYATAANNAMGAYYGAGANYGVGANYAAFNKKSAAALQREQAAIAAFDSLRKQTAAASPSQPPTRLVVTLLRPRQHLVADSWKVFKAHVAQFRTEGWTTARKEVQWGGRARRYDVLVTHDPTKAKKKGQAAARTQAQAQAAKARIDAGNAAAATSSAAVAAGAGSSGSSVGAGSSGSSASAAQARIDAGNAAAAIFSAAVATGVGSSSSSTSTGSSSSQGPSGAGPSGAHAARVTHKSGDKENCSVVRSDKGKEKAAPSAATETLAVAVDAPAEEGSSTPTVSWRDVLRQWDTTDDWVPPNALNDDDYGHDDWARLNDDDDDHEEEEEEEDGGDDDDDDDSVDNEKGGHGPLCAFGNVVNGTIQSHTV